MFPIVPTCARSLAPGVATPVRRGQSGDESMSAALWYWREGSTQHGPITWEKLQSLASAGKMAPSDWVMREGWNDWKLACEANDPTGEVEPVGPLPAPPLLRLPPLAPEQTVGDIGLPSPSPDGVSEGDVVQRRGASRDGQSEGRPALEINAAAITALAASTMGLLFLAFEMGLVGVGLGGWCLCAASATGRSNGKGLALAAVVIGAVNVVFRVMCATMDLGLPNL